MKREFSPPRGGPVANLPLPAKVEASNEQGRDCDHESSDEGD
jgi:hypothetical protein